VKDYVRQSKLGSQEMFVPLGHGPGEAQADFGEAVVVIARLEQTARFMVFDLPHSETTALDSSLIPRRDVRGWRRYKQVLSFSLRNLSYPSVSARP
jgi:hypothetical protein